MKYIYLLALTCFFNAHIVSKQPTSKLAHTQFQWYHSYRKATLTGSLIGALMVPIKPFGYGLALRITGESTIEEVLTKFIPHFKKSLIVSACSGALAACFVVAVLKALDLGRRERKKQLEQLYKEIHDTII